MNAQAAVICLNPKAAGPDGAPYLVTNTSTVQEAVGYLWGEKRRNRGDSGACPACVDAHRRDGAGEPGEPGDRLVQVD